jgi:uncharacterized membrane protein
MEGMDGGKPLVPWWVLLSALFGWILLMRVAVSIADALVVVVLFLSFVFLGVAGWLWGADSRDGNDWKPTRRASVPRGEGAADH